MVSRAMRPPSLRPPRCAPPRCAPPVLLAFVLALIGSAAPAAAEPELHGIPVHVRAGTALEITWTGLGPEAHEAELELSLAGGRWVRISPELGACEGHFTWHVPAGLVGLARLRLKYGGDWFEAEGVVSTSFRLEAEAGSTVTIVPDPGLGEWWGLGHDFGTLPSRQVSRAASLQPTDHAPALSPEPDRMARDIESMVCRTAVHEPAFSRRETIARRQGVSRCYPLRI